MLIRVGYDLELECPAPTAVVAKLSVHPSRCAAIRRAERLIVEPRVPVGEFRDEFDNRCIRLRVPAGRTRFRGDALIVDGGEPDPHDSRAAQHGVCALPAETLRFLMPSRYCDVELLGDFAWRQFGSTPDGWPRVQAVCDFVHRHVRYEALQARATRTASETYEEHSGVCRDFAHLAITLCRCMNVPARYCAGYLPEIGVPPAPEPMDFHAWFEAFLGDRWYAFDARHNLPRVGRVPMARGRDAADTAMLTTFGPGELTSFEVWAERVDTALALIARERLVMPRIVEADPPTPSRRTAGRCLRRPSTSSRPRR